MSLHRNRVQMTVSAVDGVTGELTLNAATTGYQSFSSAYGADATVDILITENNTWEVDRNCAYDNTNGKVTRGTLEASSSGSAVSFTSAAIVSVIATAATGNNWGLNEIQASPNAAVTGVVGTMHILDISGFTASRDFTLPATCAVGDRVGVFIKVGDADYELSLKPASGDTINGGSPAAEWSRLFITGECVIFRCITADTDWIVEYDGRIACNGMLRETTATTLSHATWTKITVDAQVYDVGDIADPSTNNRVNIRRAGNYLAVGLVSVAALAVNSRVIPRIYKNGNVEIELTRAAVVVTGSGVGSGTGAIVCAAGDYLELWGLWSVVSGTGTKDTDVATGIEPYLIVTEVLK